MFTNFVGILWYLLVILSLDFILERVRLGNGQINFNE